MDGSVHTSPLRKISSKALKKISENELKISLFSTVSLLALTGCGGGGGGGIFATSGAGGAGGGALLGGMLLKGPISGARVYQDLNFNNQYDTGEPTAFTNPDGSYSLSVANRTAPIITVGGIDTTTGADAGAFKFDSGEDISTVTPVSVVVSQLDPLIDQNTAFVKFSDLSSPVNFSDYNPIQTAADAGGANSDAAIVDAVGAQMQSTINGLSTLLAEISSIASQNSYQDAVDAIVAEINSGSSVDFENPAHLVSIFNRTGLSSLEFSPVVTSVTNAIAEVNKQLYTMFTQDSGDFLDADARGIALLAQTDLVEAISNLASSPVDDAASSLQAQFSADNVASLATQLANQVPEYDPVTGAASIIASMDRVKGEIGSTVTTSNLVSNDVVVSGTAPLVAVGLSTLKTGENDLNALFSKDIGKKTGHGLSTGQIVTDGTDDYYLAKIDENHFVLATTPESAEALSIHTATYDESNGTYLLPGNTLSIGNEITLFDSENGIIGDSYQIGVEGDQFSLVNNPSIVSDGANISFVNTSELYQSDSATPNLTYKKFFLTKTDSNGIVATLNPSDGTVSIDIPDDVSPGTYTFFYQVTDQDGKVGVGPINIDVPVKKPTLNIQDTITDIPEQKDGNYLEIDLGKFIDFDLSSSSTANLSFRGFNQSDLHGDDGNIGLFFKSRDSSTPTMTMLESKERQIVITDETNNKASIKDNLVIRLDKDFVGSIDLSAFITVTNNNKFSSATDVLKFNVTPVADTPVIALTDRSTIENVDVEGVEDLPVRIFKTENGDNILSLTSGDLKNTETLSLIVKKNVVLDGVINPVAGNFVDALTLSSIGIPVKDGYDFGSGAEDALEFTQSEFDNLSIILPSNYEGKATLQVVAKSKHDTSEAFSSIQNVVVKALPSVDDVSISVNETVAGVEDTAFYVNLTANQIDTGEDLRVFIGNFERQDASGNWVAVDTADIGGVSGFRPSVFATYSNNFFMFSSLPGDDGNLVDLQSGQNLSFEFLPLTDFNGNLRYQVFSRTIESDGVSKDTSVVTRIQNFDPRSEDPNVELGGNLTTNEYQGQSNYVSQKLGIGDLQVDQADSLEMMRATIKFFTNSDPFDSSAATLLSSAGNFTTLDISSVPSNLLSNLSIDNSTPGQFIIDVTPTKTDGVVTTSSVDNLKTIMSNIGVRPPEDYSTNSGNDIRVEIQIQAKEPGAEFSAPSGGDFTLIVNPVASKPTLADENSGTRVGLEDVEIKISDGITFTVDDRDGSESIVAVNISGVSLGYALIDSSKNAIGVSDGAGTVTLTNVSLVQGTSNQYKLSNDVFLRAPNDHSGDINLSISAIAKENNSGATFVSETLSINVTIAPDADEPSVSVPSSSNSSPIKIGEYVSGSTYVTSSDYIKLTTSISELNPDEEMEGIIRFKQSSDGNNKATFLLNDGSSPTAVASNHADYKTGYDTYVLSENDVKNKLSGASFRPPEGVINKDNDSYFDPTYIVEVIGRSKDGSDVGTTEKTISYQIAAVAKAPNIKDEDGIDLDTSFDIGDVIKTGDGSNTHKMKIALDIKASGDEQITLLMTNLPSSLKDYMSFENAEGTAIGAKNADGSVYVLTMDQLEVDGSAGISSSTEYFYLVLSSGAQIGNPNDIPTSAPNYNFTGSLSDVGNSSGFQIDENGIIRDSTETPLRQKNIELDLTGFALDTVGGTTASKGLRGSGDIYYIHGDPLVINFGDGLLDDSNFTLLADALDINMDGVLDTVYMPNSNTGLLIYDKDNNEFSEYVDQDSQRLNLKDHIFSEFFKFGNLQGTSSLHSISLLDEKNVYDATEEIFTADGIINSNDTNNFGKIYIWRDANTDGVLNEKEFTPLASDASLDLSSISLSNQGWAGNSAYILTSAKINLGISGGGEKDLYEVSLENTINTPTNAPDWQGKDISFVTKRQGGTELRHVEFNEGLTDGTETLHLNLSPGSGLTSSHVTLITIRGLPDTLSLNKGSKLDNGDWLLLEEDIPVEIGDSDLKIIAQDLNFSGSFSLSAWSVTSEPLSGESTVSKPVYLVGNILPVADNPNLFVQTDGVVGEEDDTGIPITIRYELSDGSETVDIKLEINKLDVASPTIGGKSLKFTYEGGEINVSNMQLSEDGNTYTYTFRDILSANDPKITSLKIVPAEDYFSTNLNPLNLTVSAIVTDGAVVGSPIEETINVVIEERADPVEISFDSSIDPQVNTTINQENDTDILSAERITSASNTLEIDTYEKIASDVGIVILKTDQSGNYDILNKSSDESNLLNNEIQSIKFEISGLTPKSDASSLISQFILQVDENSYVPKVELNNDLETFTFIVPSLDAGKSLKLITPENFDGIPRLNENGIITYEEISFKIYTVVSANGDTALSEPINLNIDVFSDGSPADVSVSPSTAIEDGPAFRLPLTVTLKDNSENITSLKLDSSQLNEILYLTRLQNLSLDEEGTSIDGINFVNNFISSPELIIRFSNNFKSSLEIVSLEKQIKTEFENGNDTSTKVSNIESLLQSFGLNQNVHWNFFAKGQSLDSDGVEETNFEQLNFQGGNFLLSSSSNNLEKKEFVENTIDSLIISKVGNTFTIDLEQLATNISPIEASSETLKQAQIWISGKLGGKVTSDTTIGFDVNVTVITEDADNKDSSSTDSNFGAGLFDTRELFGKTEQVLKVTFVETNDLPVVTNFDNDMIYHEGGDHVLLLTQAGFSDEDNINFNGGTISAKLTSPESGDNIFVFNSASISLSGTGELSDSQPTVGVLDSNNVVIGQLQKSFSEDGNDVIGFNLTLNEEADASDIEAIFHAIGYSNSGSILETRDVPYEISIEDGSGPDINGNPSTKILGNVITAIPQPIGTYVEGDELAQNEVAPTTINLFETIDISDNGFTPDSIQLKISNFISGDIIGTTSTLVTSSYDQETGILSITSNVSSGDNNEKTASFHDAINKTFYSSSNDNPTQLYMNNDHSVISNDRTIQVVSIDNSSTTTVDEGRVIGTFKVEFTPKDDLPELIVNDFNRVQLSAVTNDEGLSQLKVQSTQLLPNTLFDQTETDALDITKFGETASGLIFDPDSIINEITIEITSIDPLSLNAAKSQDKLIFKSSTDAGFEVEGEDGTSVLKIKLSNEIIESQTNADNQVMIETALRNIYYENNEPLSQVITGFRDLKIIFKDIDDVTSVMYDSANKSEHQKVIQVGSVNVGNSNVLPSISGIETPVTFHEGADHIFLVSEGQINDQNNLYFPGGVVKVSLKSPFEGEQIKLIGNETIAIKDNKFVDKSNNTIEYGHFYNKISEESVYNFTSEQLQAITNDGISLNEGLYSIVLDTQNTHFYLQEIDNNNGTINPVEDSYLIKLSENFQSQAAIDSFISSEELISEGNYHRVEMLINFSTSSSDLVGKDEVEAIFKTIGYTLNSVSEEFNNGTTNYDISIHDGFGMDVTGKLFNHFSGQVVRTAQENDVEFVEGSGFAEEDISSTEVGLFDNISLIGSGVPHTVEVVVTDLRSGDILKTISSNVEQNYNSETGILSLTNPLGLDNFSKLQSFEDALNNIIYTSENDNPTFKLNDIERSTDLERLIEINILDNLTTDDINEARTVSKIKVNLTSDNDDPIIIVNKFNRVQLLPVTEEDGSTQLKAQSTFLLPISLDDQPGIDALGTSSYGKSSYGLIFDPDSIISQITIEITSPNISTSDLAKNQDKLIFAPSFEEGFVLEGEEGSSILTIRLSQDITESQTNANNQAMVEEALRSIKYENDKSLSEIISGFRDIKITFKDINDVVTVPYDTSVQPELAKVLIGKAFEPNDTHNSLNIPISENQINPDQMMANIQFKIITESRVEDIRDELFIIDENDNIIDTIDYLDASADGFAQYEWKPNVSLTNDDIIGILKNKIAFGGEFFIQSGLRTIQVEIYDQNGHSIGPEGLNTVIFVQPHDRNSVSGIENGDVVDRLDIADDSNERDVVDYSKFNKNFPLTINLETNTTSYQLIDGSTKQVQVQGFNNVVGSDADDMFIASSTGDANHFAGGKGDDQYSGNGKDFINYSLEDAYSENDSLKFGINADLTTGKIIDTYGETDNINASNPITNIVGSKHNDIIIDSIADNIILGGYGEDRIISSGGNDSLRGGLGDDLIEVGEGDDVIYGDNEISSGGKDTFIFKGQFGNDTIEDFEINNDKVILEVNENDSITLEGLDTNSVKIKKTNTQDNFLTLNSTAGIITASTLALATSEVMGLTTLSSVNTNLDGNDDIIDFSKITDTSLNFNLDNKTFFNEGNDQFEFDGYENIIGGSNNDIIFHSDKDVSGSSYGLVGGQGTDHILALNSDVIRYDLEEKYRTPLENVYGVQVNLSNLLNQPSKDTYGNDDYLIADNVYGTSLSDIIIGNENSNIIYGYGGNDNLSGLGGDDVIVGGLGSDFIDGGIGNDVLTGDDGYVQNTDFFLFKGLASDISSFGNDIVTDFEVGLDYARIFLSNNDELINDTSYIYGTKISTGASTIEFEWSRYEQFDKYEVLMASIQEVRLLDGSLENLIGAKAAQGVDDVVQLSKLGSENQDGYLIDVGFQQMISLSNDSESYELAAMENYDNFIGSAGDDIIIGVGSEGSGLAGGQGKDVIYGNSLDYLAYDLEEELITEEIIGSQLNKISNHHVKVNLGDGDVQLGDILIDARTADDIWGAKDTIIGIENVRGTSGNDIVFGSENSNTILTGDGNDTIHGGAGDDILDGGDGQDTFIFLASDYENRNNTQDTILNFNKDEDALSFDEIGMGQVSISYFEDDQSLADTVISFNNNPDWGSIVLVDVGKLNENELNIDTDAVVGGIG